MIILVHWAHLLALALLVGALTMLLVVVPAGRRVRPDEVIFFEHARRRAGVVARWAVIVLFVTLILEVALRALEVARGDVGVAFDGASPRSLLFGSRYGVASTVCGLALVAALWAVSACTREESLVALPRAPRPDRQSPGFVAAGLWHPRGRPFLTRNAWQRIAVLLSALVLFSTVLAGPYGYDPLAALAETLHLAATDLWLGGTIALAVTVAPFLLAVDRSRRARTALIVLDRFSPVALGSVVVMVLTGLWETTHTPYSPGGRVPAIVDVALGVKSLLVVAMIGVSAWGSVVLRPRVRRLAPRVRRDSTLAPTLDVAVAAVRRLVRVNPWLAVAAICCSAVTDAALDPGRTVPISPQAQMTGRAGSIAVRLTVGPVAVGFSGYDVLLLDRGRRPLNDAVVTVTSRSLETGGMDPPVTRLAAVGPGRYRGRGIVTMGGRSRVRVSIRGASVMASTVFTIGVAPLHAPKATVAPIPGQVVSRPIVTASGHATGSAASTRLESATWQPVGAAAPVHAFLYRGATPTVMYEGTETGVFRSPDTGAHWFPASTRLSGAAREVWSLTFLRDGSLLAATGGGVYRSTDGARSWHASGLHGRAVYALAVHAARHVAILAGGDGGIFRSDDLAAHWRQVYGTGGQAINALAWPSAQPALIVAGVNPGPRPVVMSYDGGGTWLRQSRGLPPAAGMMSVAVTPDARWVYAGSMGAGAYRLARGTSWQAVSNGLPGLPWNDAHVGAFAFDPSGRDTVYAATEAGVYRSLDRGRRWAPYGGVLSGDAAAVTSLVLVSGPRPVLYALTMGGLFRHPL